MSDINVYSNLDILFSGQLNHTIQEFMSITNGSFYIGAIIKPLEELKTSNIISELMINPNDESAYAALTEYVSKSAGMINNFPKRLIRILSTKIVFQESIGRTTKSIIVKLNPNVETPTIVTKNSAQTQAELILEDISNSNSYKSCVNLNHNRYEHFTPQEVRKKLPKDVLQLIVNGIVSLNNTIEQYGKTYGYNASKSVNIQEHN